MSGSNKRRKLDVTNDAPISAFQARQKAQTETVVADAVIDKQPQLALAASELVEEEARSTTSASSPSREASPELLAIERQSIAFSTYVPNSNNTSILRDGSLSLKLCPGERMIILGEYEISVQKGQIAILHMTLPASKKRYRVFAPSSHSLPVIRCLATDANVAEISLHQSKSGLRELETLSPLFARMWNNEPKMIDSQTFQLEESGEKSSSFQILLSPSKAAGKSYLQPVISPPEWNELLYRISVVESEKPECILVCGPKSSGKSTFTKLLANRLLSQQMALCSKTKPGIGILDIDPGQPEYSTPGQLSLAHITEPNLGPSYSHPMIAANSRVVRAHTIAAITPAEDPDLYVSCVLDLYSHYRSLQSSFPSRPLVVNTPGWVQGTGLEILVKIRPSHVIYMSTEGPVEVVKDLQQAAPKNTFHALPSQVSVYTTRTAAHLRTMQTMSYFHVGEASNKSPTWYATPLIEIPPWEYVSSFRQSFSAIHRHLQMSREPSAELLLDSINGSLVHPLILRTPVSNLPYFNPSNTTKLLPQHSSCIGLALIRGIDIGRQRLQILTPLSRSVADEINDQGRKIVLVSGKLDTPGWAYTENLIRSRNEDDSEDVDEEEAESLRETPWVERLEGSQGRGMAARVWRVRRDLGKSDGGG
ncbi:hypothetical protein BJ878DRAFT_476672 [Calycina marina]|uniref:Polynucleotide 5'-hydroxyl-kinase GRC3 n=1 Tax=Calycina marina TaxID=1763456 RepID=A0A9P7ZAQ0_9HELO|nr:hypothetical protein BJ878DRAFT_476672 [Calycina marina]